MTKFSHELWDTTAPLAPHWLLLETGADLSCMPPRQHFLIRNNTPSVCPNHTLQSLKHCVIMHIWNGLFPQNKGFLSFVRWLHVEAGVTITIFDIFSEIMALSLKVWKVKWFINLPVCEPACSGSSFVSLSNTSSWYSKKFRQVYISKCKMTAKDIMMLSDTSYSCFA